MRRVLTILLVLSCVVSLATAKGKESIIKFDTSQFNFGTFPQKQVRGCVFAFKNTGNAPLLINNVSTTCNCTSATHTKTPVLPGKVGYITVYFNGNLYSKGHFHKNVDVYSNAANGMFRLFIEGITQ